VPWRGSLAVKTYSSTGLVSEENLLEQVKHNRVPSTILTKYLQAGQIKNAATLMLLQQRSTSVAVSG
jgi:hypothetical protein